jgi:hypothetical protein
MAFWAAGGALPGSLRPQAPLRIGSSLGTSAVWEESSVATTVTRRSAVVLDWRGWASAGLIDLDLFYRSGSLSAATPAADRDLVEGSVMLGVRIARWLELEGGPRIRAYVTPARTERWILWEGRARLTAQVLGPSVRSYLVLGRAFGADLGSTLPFGRERAGEAGLLARIGRTPVWTQLGYWVTQTSVAAGQRVETLQGLALSLGLGVR